MKCFESKEVEYFSRELNSTKKKVVNENGRDISGKLQRHLAALGTARGWELRCQQMALQRYFPAYM